MKQTNLFIVFALCVNSTLGQTTNKKYSDLIRKANSQNASKNYKESANTYCMAFKVGGNKTLTIDRFKAACSWALASKPDSAFSQLNKIMTKTNLSDYSYITQNEDLVSLHNDNRWQLILTTIQQNKEESEIIKNKFISQHLERMSQPIQRTPQKHIPIARPLVKSIKAHPTSIAILADRTALRQGKKQIYGTQVARIPQTHSYYVLPIEDPTNVDKRRAELKLQPLAEYVSHWKINWDAEANNN
jgi:hypothetical protein